MNDIYLKRFDCEGVSYLRHSIDHACYSYLLTPLKGLRNPVSDNTPDSLTPNYTILIPKSPVRDDRSLSPVRDDTSLEPARDDISLSLVRDETSVTCY